MPRPRHAEAVAKSQRYRLPAGNSNDTPNSPTTAEIVATHPYATGSPKTRAMYGR